MAVEFALWPACVKAHDFPDQLAAAAEAGYDRLPIGNLTYRALRESGHSAAAVRAMARDAGVRLGHFDGFSDWAPIRFAEDFPAPAKAVFDLSADHCLQICDELGLDAICATGAFAPGQVPVPALIDSFGEFCRRAERQGVRVDLEFIPMWGIPSLELAWTIVRDSGAGNAGILFDCWHFFRGKADMELLRAMPAGSIATVQLADAANPPASDDLLTECLCFRKLPGEGNFPLQEVVGILRDKGGVVSVGPEIFSDELDQLDAREAALRTAAASERLLTRAGWSLKS